MFSSSFTEYDGLELKINEVINDLNVLLAKTSTGKNLQTQKTLETRLETLENDSTPLETEVHCLLHNLRVLLAEIKVVLRKVEIHLGINRFRESLQRYRRDTAELGKLKQINADTDGAVLTNCTLEHSDPIPSTSLPDLNISDLVAKLIPLAQKTDQYSSKPTPTAKDQSPTEIITIESLDYEDLEDTRSSETTLKLLETSDAVVTSPAPKRARPSSEPPIVKNEYLQLAESTVTHNTTTKEVNGKSIQTPSELTAIWTEDFFNNTLRQFQCISNSSPQSEDGSATLVPSSPAPKRIKLSSETSKANKELTLGNISLSHKISKALCFETSLDAEQPYEQQCYIEKPSNVAQNGKNQGQCVKGAFKLPVSIDLTRIGERVKLQLFKLKESRTKAEDASSSKATKTATSKEQTITKPSQNAPICTQQSNKINPGTQTQPLNKNTATDQSKVSAIKKPCDSDWSPNLGTAPFTPQGCSTPLPYSGEINVIPVENHTVELPPIPHAKQTNLYSTDDAMRDVSSAFASESPHPSFKIGTVSFKKAAGKPEVPTQKTADTPMVKYPPDKNRMEMQSKGRAEENVKRKPLIDKKSRASFKKRPSTPKTPVVEHVLNRSGNNLNGTSSSKAGKPASIHLLR